MQAILNPAFISDGTATQTRHDKTGNTRKGHQIGFRGEKSPFTHSNEFYTLRVKLGQS